MQISRRNLLIARVLLFPCMVLGQQASSPSASPSAQATLSENIEPPSGAREILRLVGRGFQIYVCSNVSGQIKWTLKAPDAKLYNADGIQVGTHFAGPTWRLDDSSSVSGHAVASKKSPDPGSVSWLLLSVTAHGGKGKLDDVEDVQRSNTRGGVAPINGCDANHQGAQIRVPYTATYTFFGRLSKHSASEDGLSSMGKQAF